MPIFYNKHIPSLEAISISPNGLTNLWDSQKTTFLLKTHAQY